MIVICLQLGSWWCQCESTYFQHKRDLWYTGTTLPVMASNQARLVPIDTQVFSFKVYEIPNLNVVAGKFTKKPNVKPN